MSETKDKLTEWSEHMLGIQESPRLKKLGIGNHGVGLND